MLLPRRRRLDTTFPFDNPNARYVHFARNAIYFIARQMGLTGADVLVPAYFHGVEIEALLAAGVRPRFFPVHERMRVDPEDVIALLRPETRAIYLIHYLGFPGPVHAIRQVCSERGLLFIEDCALALLSKTGDEPLGSFGDAAVFCLYKTLPTPDGGAAVLREGRLELEGRVPDPLGTAREVAASVLRRFETYGGALSQGIARSVKAIGKALTPSRRQDWVDVGTQRFNVADTNLLMSGVTRTIVDAQDFDAIVRARRRNYLHLQSLLEDLSPPAFESLPDGVCPLSYPFVTHRKHELWSRLRASGVQAVLFWLPGELSTPRGAFPEVDKLRETVLELPCHQDLTPEHIERVARTVRTIVRELDS